ncbi:Nitroreductase [Marininema mesophilum]|uniref:Nitroreductase n=1 Tax=Marininema mesophilum TaxID=1048340 RepID=A0A1H3AHZ1_9BACL|nr:nitroreductase family protein [Marininema mesophilum]SDX29296.1 Nitroreductase [Marininema mesophilum]
MAMSVKQAMETRCSIRTYLQEPVPREDIEEIIRLTRLAPSAWNIQPWRFIVVTNKETKQELYNIANKHPQVESAPVAIVVTSDMEDAIANLEEFIHPSMPEDARAWLTNTIPKIFGEQTIEQRGQWGVAQSNIALGYLLIAIRSLGYDSSPMYGFNPYKVRELFELSDHVQIPSIVTLGRRGEEGREHHRHSLDKLIRYV